jgi:hypothetical protein
MRDIVGEELHWLSHGYCPACDGKRFQPGPKGGAAQNVECVSCGLRFNVTIREGQLLFAQEIGHRRDGADWSDYERRFQPRALFERDR